MEESAALYSKARELLAKLKEVEHMLLSPDLDLLMSVDVNLQGLWGSFEKEAMAAIERVADGTLTPIRLPKLFGYPETVYYYNGVLAFHTFDLHVWVVLSVALEEGGQNAEVARWKAEWPYSRNELHSRDILRTLRGVFNAAAVDGLIMLRVEHGGDSRGEGEQRGGVHGECCCDAAELEGTCGESAVR